MFRGLFIGWALCVGGMLATDYALTNNRPLIGLTLLNDRQAILAEDALGELYFSGGKYREAAFYFGQIMKDYPDNPKTETAFFYWLESERFGHFLNQAQMADRCRDYLDRYPEDSDHAAMIRDIYDRNAMLEDAGVDTRTMGLRRLSQWIEE